MELAAQQQFGVPGNGVAADLDFGLEFSQHEAGNLDGFPSISEILAATGPADIVKFDEYIDNLLRRLSM